MVQIYQNIINGWQRGGPYPDAMRGPALSWGQITAICSLSALLSTLLIVDVEVIETFTGTRSAGLLSAGKAAGDAAPIPGEDAVCELVQTMRTNASDETESVHMLVVRHMGSWRVMHNNTHSYLAIKRIDAARAAIDGVNLGIDTGDDEASRLLLALEGAISPMSSGTFNDTLTGREVRFVRSSMGEGRWRVKGDALLAEEHLEEEWSGTFPRVSMEGSARYVATFSPGVSSASLQVEPELENVTQGGGDATARRRLLVNLQDQISAGGEAPVVDASESEEAIEVIFGRTVRCSPVENSLRIQASPTMVSGTTRKTIRVASRRYERVRHDATRSFIDVKFGGQTGVFVRPDSAFARVFANVGKPVFNRQVSSILRARFNDDDTYDYSIDIGVQRTDRDGARRFALSYASPKKDADGSTLPLLDKTFELLPRLPIMSYGIATLYGSMDMEVTADVTGRAVFGSITAGATTGVKLSANLFAETSRVAPFTIALGVRVKGSVARLRLHIGVVAVPDGQPLFGAASADRTICPRLQFVKLPAALSIKALCEARIYTIKAGKRTLKTSRKCLTKLVDRLSYFVAAGGGPVTLIEGNGLFAGAFADLSPPVNPRCDDAWTEPASPPPSGGGGGGGGGSGQCAVGAACEAHLLDNGDTFLYSGECAPLSNYGGCPDQDAPYSRVDRDTCGEGCVCCV